MPPAWALAAFVLPAAAGAGSFKVVVAEGSRGHAAAHAAPLTVEELPFHPFGSARYPDLQPPLTWGDLGTRRRLGAACDPEREAAPQCGKDLVCRQGLCRHCAVDADCPSLHLCASAVGRSSACVPIERKAWEIALTNPMEGLCTILIFMASTLAATAGTGGGGIFVPILVSLSSLKARSAVPLCQCMILCSSLVNLAVFVAQRHPDSPHLPVIDYDCVMLFEPLLFLGVTFGVLVNLMAPQWLLLLVLFATLGVALWRTISKGLRQLRQEQTAALLNLSGELSRKPYTEAFVELTNRKAWQIVGAVVVWLLMLASSFHGFPPCSGSFATFLTLLAAVLVACAVVAAHFIASTGSDSALERSPVDWVSGGELAKVLRFPLVAFGAGFLGGLLGLGGGVIVGPVLLEMGMHSEAVQATTAAFVFLSSSIATIQFAVLSQHVWHYALWYSAVTVAATILGQYLCEVYVRRRRQYSYVTLAIAGVLLASLAGLSVVGVHQLAQDLHEGGQVGFSTSRLCEVGHGIVAVDVLPEAWPADLPFAGGD